ncbi:hypothetical protein [Kitasatospora sp. NBC_01300]|uniref:hypothetical protein n=1 Tax=Kitasatospora sp. NBC_01300 TaxID=2903574 RepID=UPI00352E1D8C|nr:hypothetical protein OG556_04820 [Kitasatospora sp. NBC_01300]
MIATAATTGAGHHSPLASQAAPAAAADTASSQARVRHGSGRNRRYTRTARPSRPSPPATDRARDKGHTTATSATSR